MVLRYMHANGASMFFIVVYSPFRGLYFGSYASPRELVWIVGVVASTPYDFNCIYWICTSLGTNVFLGATVITSLASAIPVVGMDITYWLWGFQCR